MGFINPIYAFIIPFLVIFTLPIAFLAGVATTVAFSVLVLRAVVTYLDLALALLPQRVFGIKIPAVARYHRAARRWATRYATTAIPSRAPSPDTFSWSPHATSCGGGAYASSTGSSSPAGAESPRAVWRRRRRQQQQQRLLLGSDNVIPVLMDDDGHDGDEEDYGEEDYGEEDCGDDTDCSQQHEEEGDYEYEYEYEYEGEDRDDYDYEGEAEDKEDYDYDDGATARGYMPCYDDPWATFNRRIDPQDGQTCQQQQQQQPDQQQQQHHHYRTPSAESGTTGGDGYFVTRSRNRSRESLARMFVESPTASRSGAGSHGTPTALTPLDSDDYFSMWTKPPRGRATN